MPVLMGRPWNIDIPLPLPPPASREIGHQLREVLICTMSGTSPKALQLISNHSRTRRHTRYACDCASK